jgi:hypothetical protein
LGDNLSNIDLVYSERLNGNPDQNLAFAIVCYEDALSPFEPWKLSAWQIPE